MSNPKNNVILFSVTENNYQGSFMRNKEINYLIFNKDTVLVKTVDQQMVLPNNRDINPDELKENNIFTLKETNNTITYLIEANDTFNIPNEFEFLGLRSYRDHHYEYNFKLAVEGLHLLNWSRSTMYCGTCGHKHNPMSKDRSKKCPNCHTLIFPQTSMAVITGILKDGKILLAHNANFPEGLYSLIAGFVELGESLENAVKREIMEEVGLKVKNIRYFGSQPWPFPNSMMIGFLADYDSEDINTDDVEILDANWYSPENFPEIPHEYSIARKIINYYKVELAKK